MTDTLATLSMQVAKQLAELPKHLACQNLPAEACWQQHPLPLDTHFNNSPTLACTISTAAGVLATWKCNLFPIIVPVTSTNIANDVPRLGLLCAPLVVIWQPEAVRPHGIGHQLMNTIADILPKAAQASGFTETIWLASGNLTVERQGRPFFESLAWPIIKSVDEISTHAHSVHNAAALEEFFDLLSIITADHRAQTGTTVSFALSRHETKDT